MCGHYLGSLFSILRLVVLRLLTDFVWIANAVAISQPHVLLKATLSLELHEVHPLLSGELEVQGGHCFWWLSGVELAGVVQGVTALGVIA